MLGLIMMLAGAAQAFPFQNHAQQTGYNSLDYLTDLDIADYLHRAEQQQEEEDSGYLAEEPEYRNILPTTNTNQDHLPWYTDQIGLDTESFWPALDENNPADILDLSALEENYLRSRLSQSPEEVRKRSQEIYDTYKLAQDPAITSRKVSILPREIKPSKKAVIPKKFTKNAALPTSAALTSPVKPRPWSCRPRSAECPRRLSFVRPAVLSASPHSNNDDLRRTIAVAASAQSAPLASQRHFSPLKLL